MEKLSIQELNSVVVNSADVDYTIDTEFKAGLFKQVESFLCDLNDGKKLLVGDHLRHMTAYAQMEHKAC